MVPTSLSTLTLIGPIPGGPELLIIFMLFFMLLIPAATFAAGVGVGWWLRGRDDEQGNGSEHAGGTEPHN